MTLRKRIDSPLPARRCVFLSARTTRPCPLGVRRSPFLKTTAGFAKTYAFPQGRQSPRKTRRIAKILRKREFLGDFFSSSEPCGKAWVFADALIMVIGSKVEKLRACGAFSGGKRLSCDGGNIIAYCEEFGKVFSGQICKFFMNGSGDAPPSPFFLAHATGRLTILTIPRHGNFVRRRPEKNYA